MKWTKKQQRYIEWCATPQSEREPSTQAGVADVLGVSRMTVWRWQHKPGFWVEVDNQIKAWVGKRTPDILGAQVTKAIAGGKFEEGDVAAARLVLGYAGKYEEKRGSGVNVAIFQQDAGRLLLGVQGAVNDLIELYVPDEERFDARRYLGGRLGAMAADFGGGEPIEAGVFLPVLQDKE